MKPKFLVIGCGKCGSTFLYECITDHPSINKNKMRKEIRFFDLNYLKGIEKDPLSDKDRKFLEDVLEVSNQLFYEETRIKWD
jgi:hypothetical protein